MILDDSMRKLNTVMLVDDDEITNFINENLIQDLEIANQILVATNGQESIQKLLVFEAEGKDLPELILLDINMPVMNGFEFLEEYQKIDFTSEKPIVLIVLTSSENESDIQKIQKSAVVDYLNKPLTEQKIARVLEKHFTEQ